MRQGMQWFAYDTHLESVTARDIDVFETEREASAFKAEKETFDENFQVLPIETVSTKIDELIITYAQGWDLDRMPSIDRNLLRIALFEILYNEDIDDKIAVSEAVALAKELSTDDSAGYINGVLGRLIALKPSLAL